MNTFYLFRSSLTSLLFSSLALLHSLSLFLSFSQFFSPPPVHLWRIGSSPHLCTSFLSLTLPFLFLISPASLFFYYLSPSALVLCCSFTSATVSLFHPFTSFCSSLAILSCSFLIFSLCIHLILPFSPLFHCQPFCIVLLLVSFYLSLHLSMHCLSLACKLGAVVVVFTGNLFENSVAGYINISIFALYFFMHFPSPISH